MVTWFDFSTYQIVANAAAGDGVVVGPVVESGSPSMFVAGPAATGTAANINVASMAASSYAGLQNSVASPWMMVGGSAGDTLFGGLGNNVIDGNDGNDNLGSAFGVNWIDGGNGADTLFAGLAPSVYIGGSGADTLVVASAPGNLLLTKTTLNMADPNTSTVSSYTGNMVLNTFNNVNYGFVDKSVESITYLPSGTVAALS